MNPVLPASVVICSRNRPTFLAAAVESILSGDALPAEIIVIDQSDEPYAAVPAADIPCRVRHVLSTTRGLSGGRNHGAAESTQELIAFTDDDMTADPQWLGALVRALDRLDPRDVVTGRVLPGPRECAGAFVPSLVKSDIPAIYQGRLRGDVLAGGNMAVRRSAFLDAGAFDERLGAGSRFPAAEDNDFGFRLLERGARIAYVPEALLYHRAWRPASEYVSMKFAYGRGKGGFYAKHLRIADTHMMRRLLRDLGWRAVRAPRLALHPRLAAGEIAYGIGVVRGVVEWFARPPSPDAGSRLISAIGVKSSPV